jgi:hypothetical protein
MIAFASFVFLCVLSGNTFFSAMLLTSFVWAKLFVWYQLQPHS